VRSPFAYTPRPGPLQSASPGAAVTYLGALVSVAFLYSNPLVLAAAGVAAVTAGVVAGAGDAVRVALRAGLTLALFLLVVNGLVTDLGDTVLLRLGEWPLLGRVEVTAEALAAGAVIGLRAAVAMVAFAVYSACVDPDRVLRSLRPLAGRSALTATLISRLVPVAAADATRLRDAGRLRGPGAAPLGRATMARRLLTGSLDRAIDVAATLELRGYSLGSPRPVSGYRRNRLAGALWGPRSTKSSHERSRFDRRFYATGALVLAAAVAGEFVGADAFRAYPAVEVGVAPSTLALSLLLLISGFAPLRRKPRRAAQRIAVPPRAASEAFRA
jgi:energy-coupling factor transport system permease protein